MDEWPILGGLLAFLLLNVGALIYGIWFNIAHHMHKRNGTDCRCEWVVKYEHKHMIDCPVCRWG